MHILEKNILLRLELRPGEPGTQQAAFRSTSTV
jgi:hypothetical protein